MQKNHQPDNQFLQEMGALLAARAGQERMASPPSLTHLAEHITSARRYRKLTRAALALKMGGSEAEIYALEHGLLSYAELDLRFLGKLAVALDEEVETLLLLLGRPALVQSLQIQATHTPGHAQSCAMQRHETSDTTVRKLRGNPFGYQQWVNALYKGCLDLIDSLQQGRLSPYGYSRYQVVSMVALLLCLFLVWASDYRLPGRFNAQSELQSLVTAPAQTVEPLLSQFQRRLPAIATTTEPLTLPYRNHQTIMRTAYAIDDAINHERPMTTLSSLAQPRQHEALNCDERTSGRFMLCRM